MVRRIFGVALSLMMSLALFQGPAFAQIGEAAKYGASAVWGPASSHQGTNAEIWVVSSHADDCGSPYNGFVASALWDITGDTTFLEGGVTRCYGTQSGLHYYWANWPQGGSYVDALFTAITPRVGHEYNFRMNYSSQGGSLWKIYIANLYCCYSYPQPSTGISMETGGESSSPLSYLCYGNSFSLQWFDNWGSQQWHSGWSSGVGNARTVFRSDEFGSRGGYTASWPAKYTSFNYSQNTGAC
jgi:hypothetical protein